MLLQDLLVPCWSYVWMLNINIWWTIVLISHRFDVYEPNNYYKFYFTCNPMARDTLRLVGLLAMLIFVFATGKFIAKKNVCHGSTCSKRHVSHNISCLKKLVSQDTNCGKSSLSHGITRGKSIFRSREDPWHKIEFTPHPHFSHGKILATPTCATGNISKISVAKPHGHGVFKLGPRILMWPKWQFLVVST